LIESSLKELLSKYSIIHQVGEQEKNKFEKIRNGLSSYEKEKYEVFGSIDPMQVDGVYKRSDFIIARAGANTVSEVIFIKRPAIFIPIPFSYANEQMENAKYAKRLGIAKILPQKEASTVKLLSSLERLRKERSKMISTSKDSSDKNASSNLVDLLMDYL